VAQAQKIGGSLWQTQHNAVAIMDQDMAIGIGRRTARRGNNFKLPAVERMGGIGYLEDRGAIRAVEGGINIRYRKG
jgi:hypothetical protein